MSRSRKSSLWDKAAQDALSQTTARERAERDARRRGEKIFVVERRVDGALNLVGDQPPFVTATLDQIAKYYYAQVPGDQNVSMDTIGAWYAERGWSWREKTW